MEQDNVLEQEIEERDETNLYNKETLIAENDLVKVDILKERFNLQCDNDRLVRKENNIFLIFSRGSNFILHFSLDNHKYVLHFKKNLIW